VIITRASTKPPASRTDYREQNVLPRSNAVRRVDIEQKRFYEQAGFKTAKARVLSHKHRHYNEGEIQEKGPTDVKRTALFGVSLVSDRMNQEHTSPRELWSR